MLSSTSGAARVLTGTARPMSLKTHEYGERRFSSGCSSINPSKPLPRHVITLFVPMVVRVILFRRRRLGVENAIMNGVSLCLDMQRCRTDLLVWLSGCAQSVCRCVEYARSSSRRQ